MGFLLPDYKDIGNSKGLFVSSGGYHDMGHLRAVAFVIFIV